MHIKPLIQPARAVPTDFQPYIYFPQLCFSVVWEPRLLTVFFPEPTEPEQPARQGETYVTPFSPQTGSQLFAAQKQSELQALNKECLS